jgi:SAM-dependent methyltransferase
MTEFTYAGSELHLFEKARNWKAYWSSQVRPYVRGAVLEVGAGIGANTLLFSGCDYTKWVCLEPDASLASELRANVGGLRAVDVVDGVLDGLPGGADFDAILYIDVLEHIEDDASELRRAALRLRPGGHLVVLSPAHQWLYAPFDKAIGHFRRYSLGALGSAGPPALRQISLRYLDSVGMLASAGNRVFLKQSMPKESQILLWDRCMVPLSRMLDPVLGHRLGKSVLGIWCWDYGTPEVRNTL